MESNKKVIVAVVLLVIIVVGVVMALMKSGVIGKARAPEWVLDTPMELIDCATGELISKGLGEWSNLGQKDGKYKNPKTNTYTMVTVLECAACKQKIAMPDLPGIMREDEESVSAADARANNAKRAEAIRTYKCPKCQKSPFSQDSM